MVLKIIKGSLRLEVGACMAALRIDIPVKKVCANNSFASVNQGGGIPLRESTRIYSCESLIFFNVIRGFLYTQTS